MSAEKKNRQETGRGQRAADGHRGRRILLPGVLLTAALLTAAALCCVQALAGTAKSASKTTIIRVADEEEFAKEASKLARKSYGVTIQGTGQIRAYSSARLIVRVKDGSRVDFSKYGATTVVQSSYGICLVQFSTGNAAKKAANALEGLSAVSYVEPDDCAINTGDTRVTGVPAGGENDSGDDRTGMDGLDVGGARPGDGMDQMYQSTVRADSAKVASGSSMSWGASYIQADKYAAYVRLKTKKTIKVAVVDTGVSSHARLEGRLLKGIDLVDNDRNAADKNGHGTHVAGIIADCTPGLNVKILPVRALDASGVGSISTVGNGIRYAVRNGAKVINLSLGGYYHYKYLEECIAYANKKGVTVVVAAGNESENTRYVCPAHLSSPIVVGAINKKGRRAYFSNYGNSLDVVAPGVAIRSCWMKGGYMVADGTSMATPHISAVAAMYRLLNPSYSPAKIEKLVKQYTKDLGAKGRDNYYGCGVPRMAGAIKSK
ncbi:MAG: S8 family serine peptidase [Eubacteriales bacterium]|nr:S8 family serine peptidase [Eubacteriales bacterium]